VLLWTCSFDYPQAPNSCPLFLHNPFDSNLGLEIQEEEEEEEERGSSLST